MMASADSHYLANPDPLAGQTVLVTRPAHLAGPVVRRIESLGGMALIEPVIEILPPLDTRPLIAAAQNCDQFDLIVFASQNGVQCFADQLTALRVPFPRQLSVMAIGKSTAKLAKTCWGAPVATPQHANSHSLTADLVTRFADRRVLVVRGDRGSSVLSDKLTQHGVKFETVVAYRSVDVELDNPDLKRMLETGKIHWITATSSSIGQAVARLFGQWTTRYQQNNATGAGAKIASISPTTSDAIRKAGGTPVVEATEYNFEGLLSAIVAHVASTNSNA